MKWTAAKQANLVQYFEENNCIYNWFVSSSENIGNFGKCESHMLFNLIIITKCLVYLLFLCKLNGIPWATWLSIKLHICTFRIIVFVLCICTCMVCHIYICIYIYINFKEVQTSSERHKLHPDGKVWRRLPRGPETLDDATGICHRKKCLPKKLSARYH